MFYDYINSCKHNCQTKVCRLLVQVMGETKISECFRRSTRVYTRIFQSPSTNYGRRIRQK
jgi:hypothetical protein